MGFSTNSIIHYTKSFRNLTLILKEGFRVKYCGEDLNLGHGYSKAAHPMICFCDIRLSESGRHFSAYGKYGIGLSKSWAAKTGVNPVLYIDDNSLFAKSLYEMIKRTRGKKTDVIKELKTEILSIKSYAKNYSGQLKRGQRVIQNYRFYDEREWRLVASKSEIGGTSFSIKLTQYLKDKEKYNSKLEKYRFKFEPGDISYIIVHKNAEVSKMVETLQKIYADRCSETEMNLLFSKICSNEQILSDY